MMYNIYKEENMRRNFENRYNAEIIGELLHISHGNEQFTIDYFTKSGGAWKRRLHYHDFYELEFIIDGIAANIINGMRFELSRGKMFLIRPTDIHQYEIAEGEKLKVCTLRFSSALLDKDIINSLSGFSPLVAELGDKFDFLFELFKETEYEYKHKDRYSDMIFSDTVMRLVIMLIRKCQTNSDTPISQNRIASSAAEYINLHYSEKLTVAEVASNINVSPNHLGKVFSENMNMSFSEYLKRVRLIYALNRIINTDDTFQKIALESGFSSPSIFNREFKKYYNKKPTDIRGKNKEETK